MWTNGAVAQPQAVEVRWCSKCHQSAVVQVQQWQHTMSGTATSATTRDFRCQHCGAKYRIRPRLQTFLGLCIGVMAATTIIGIPLFVIFWRRHTVHRRIPIVPGVPPPPMRFADGPLRRRCAGCGATAEVAKVTATRINGIPAGTETIHRCGQCGREFTIQSVWGIVLGGLLGLLMGGAAAGFFAWAETPGWRWGGGIVSALVALLLVGQSVVQTMMRRRHPIIAAVIPG